MTKHTKKKASILSIATTLIGTALLRAVEGQLIEAGILFAVAASLFGAYEVLNQKEIPVSATDLQQGADTAADAIKENTEIDERIGMKGKND